MNVNGYGFDFESDGEIDGPGGGLLGPSHDGSHSTSTANGTTTVTANAGTNEAQNADFDVTMEFNSETGKATISGTAGTYPEGHEKAGEPKPFEAKTVDVKCNESTGGRSIAFSDGGTPPKDITIAWNPNKDD